MDVTKFEIFRIITQPVYNAHNEKLFDENQMVHCVEDLGTMWLAKPIGTNDIPRMLPKRKCRRLSEDEKQARI